MAEHGNGENEVQAPLPVGCTSELFWTKAETARVLRVRVSTVEDLHRTNVLRGVKIGKHLRWLPEVVAEFKDRLKEGE